jgi:threonyl-tRNA synthetase
LSDSPEVKAWTSAYLVAISIQSIFPHVEEVNVDLMGNYIAIRCRLPFELKKDFFSLIEEKIRSNAKSDSPIYMKEMVPASAKGYFKTKGVSKLYEEVMDMQLIQFFEYEGLITLCDQTLAETFFGLSHIKIVDLISHFDGSYTLLAAVGEDKKELKDCVKNYQKAKENNHLTVGEDLGLFTTTQEGVFWLKKGVSFKEKILTSLIKLHEENHFERVETPLELSFQESHAFLFEETGLERVFEVQRKNLPIEFSEEVGLFESPKITEMITSLFCTRKEIEKECISSLHFAKKISTILQFCGSFVLFCPIKMKTTLWDAPLRQVGLSYERRLGEGNIPKIEYQMKDGYGRVWSLFSLELAMISEEFCHIVCCNFPSLERAVALMLENKQQ